MKKSISLGMFGLCAGMLLAAESPLAMQPLKAPAVGKRYFRTEHFNAGWKSTEHSAKTLIPDKGYPKMDKSGGFVNQGTYKLAKGEARFTQTLTILSPTKSKYRFELKFAEKTKIDCSWMRMIVSNDEWAKKGFLIDGKFIAKIPGKDSPNMKAKVLTIPGVTDGKYILRSNFEVQLVDISKSQWVTNSLLLRIRPVPHRGMLDKLVYDIDIEYIGDSSTPLDLRPAMNMAFADDKDGDGKGGWTDQGSSNDLRCMVPGTRKLDKVDMTIVDPIANKGKSCIVLRGSQRRYFPESAKADWKTPVKGGWLYLLNATAWDAPQGVKVGDVICKFADGKTQIFEMQSGVHTGNFWMPHPLSQATIAWRGDNDVAALGLYITRIPLNNKSGLTGLAFKSESKSVWMIVAASVSENKIESEEKIRIVMQASKEWLPVKENVRKIKPGSALDFSQLLDAPAGKYGEIINQDGKLVYKNTKKPVRFYGANLCFSANYMKNKKDIDAMAENFARIGYNIVRFHHYDGGLIDFRSKKYTTPRADVLDRFDYTLAAFKKRGIYVTMDLYINRRVPNDALKSYPKGISGSFKGMVWIDPEVQNYFMEFAKNLLTHKNPYTGLMWKDEPAIINLDLVNEDAIGRVTLAPCAKPLYEKEFNKYMKAKGLKYDFYSFTRYWSMYLADCYPQYYAKVKKQLRDMGINKMLCSQNHNQDVLTMLTRQHYDIIENHTYWCHPAFLKKSWQDPTLVQNISSMTKRCGSLNSLFQSRYFGKPYSITEWDYVNPNRYAVEGAFLFGAYSALQDWNALCRFSYSHNEKELLDNYKGQMGFFNIANDPIRILSERAGILFFTRGDVQSADITIPVVLNNRHFDDAANPGELSPVPSRVGLVAKTGYITFNPDKKTALPKNTKAVIYADATGKKLYADTPAIAESDHIDGIQKLISRGVLPKDTEDYKSMIYRSTTKQIELRANELSFIVTTPRSEGFLVDEGKKVTGKFAEVKNLKNFCGVLVAAIDKGTLKDSKRILILHLTDAKETGMVFNDANMSIIEKHGKAPYLIRNGKISVKLNRSLKGFKLYALHFDGSRFKEIPMKFKGASTEFELQNDVGGTPCAAYELVK